VADFIGANAIAATVANTFGGSGGGTIYFGQGGGNFLEKTNSFEENLPGVLNDLFAKKN
jgi:hypothetical protein